MKGKPGRRDFIKRVSTLPGILAGSPRGVSAYGDQEARGMSDEIFKAGEALDTLLYSLGRYEKVRPSLTFRAGSREEVRPWQTKLRRRLVELLGDPESLSGLVAYTAHAQGNAAAVASLERFQTSRSSPRGTTRGKSVRSPAVESGNVSEVTTTMTRKSGTGSAPACASGCTNITVGALAQ